MATDIPGFPQNKLDYKVTLYNGAALLSPITTPASQLVNGMVWTTSAGLFARINGATVGPYIASAAITGWTSSLNASGVNASINASRFLASGGSTNQDAVIEAKGSGAHIAQLPDGTSVGGNKRGVMATDWQKFRNSETQVAAGDYSGIAWGVYNSANGANAGAAGISCNANGTSSICFGEGNDSSGNQSVVSGGISNSSSGLYSVVSGGRENSANADLSYINGGMRGTTRGVVGSSAIGVAYYSSVQGAAQTQSYTLAVVTTNATATPLCTDSSGTASLINQAVLVDNSAYLIKGLVVARSASTGNTKSWEFMAHLKRGSGAATTAVVGPATITTVANDTGAAAWVLSIDADTTNGCLRVRGTGAAGTTIGWFCHIYSCAQIVG